MLLGSLLGLGIPVIHMMGKGVGVGSHIANSSGAFFFVWTLIALGVTALFSAVLSVRGLWTLRGGQHR
jgi:tetrahydromethanopterin S-methyltransferase subunit C